MKFVEIWDKEANEGKGGMVSMRAVCAREVLEQIDTEGKRYLADKPGVEAKPKTEAKPKGKEAADK